MAKILEILRKVLAVAQVVGEYLAKAIELIGKLITWLSGLGATGVRKVFGIKK